MYKERVENAYFTALKIENGFWVPRRVSMMPEERRTCLTCLHAHEGVPGLDRMGRHFQFGDKAEARKFMLDYLMEHIKCGLERAGRCRYYVFQWKRRMDGNFFPQLVETVN
jgi:hypothetical protein